MQRAATAEAEDRCAVALTYSAINFQGGSSDKEEKREEGTSKDSLYKRTYIVCTYARQVSTALKLDKIFIILTRVLTIQELEDELVPHPGRCYVRPRSWVARTPETSPTESRAAVPRKAASLHLFAGKAASRLAHGESDHLRPDDTTLIYTIYHKYIAT